jgi:transposase
MMRSHARSPRGERACDHQPKARGTNYTVIGALGAEGIVATHLLDGSMRKPEFIRYLEDLLPKLRDSGRTLVMDNLRIHHAEEVKLLAEKHAVELLFVPPYTPELNPIEHAWSKLKSFLRRSRARLADALVEAVRKGLARITNQDARGWIQHAGYHLSMGST